MGTRGRALQGAYFFYDAQIMARFSKSHACPRGVGRFCARQDAIIDYIIKYDNNVRQHLFNAGLKGINLRTLMCLNTNERPELVGH